MRLIEGLLGRVRRLGQIVRFDRTLPPQILILLTNPRSGSTWLYDALRCHPAICVHPTAVIYESLGLHGRRYPRDLSGGLQSVLEVEVRSGQWEKIPAFDVSASLSEFPSIPSHDSYAIEKIHPEFFQFDVPGFCENVRRLKADGTQLRLVYQVRDPQSSITSFLHYQERNPTWYPSTRDDQVITYMCKTYEAILEVATSCRGLILDYADIAANLESVLCGVFRDLWPTGALREPGFLLGVSRAAVGATCREKRASEGSSFLGKTRGSVRGGSGDYAAFIDRFSDEMALCYEHYNMVLNLRQEA
jgi:hypothetical protein